ncbi:MAG: NlpC/P60 family protein, partial [Micrococcales bacterium]|nr:NlpC/P60 family protein [Micrococcales bacterium]
MGLVGAAPALAGGMEASAANLPTALPTSPVIAAAPEAVNTDLQEFVPDFKASPSKPSPAAGARTTGKYYAPLPAELAGDILAIAEYYKGIPYKYGGSSTSGIDCSGYVQLVYSKVGIALPHSSKKMRDTLPHIPASEARPGDLVFMYTS